MTLSFATVVFIGSTLFALQQLSGINAVFYFSSVVFKRAKVPSNIANICIGLVNLSGKLKIYVFVVIDFEKVVTYFSLHLV